MTPVLQIAVDGWWERAVVVDLPAPAETVDRLLDALGAGDAAVEVLWPGPPIEFVGAGLRRSAVHAIAARGDWTPAEALQVLAGGPPGPAVRAEVGAINAWRSVGPMAVALDAPAAAIEAALAARPDLARCGRPLALETVYASGSWRGVEVSRPASR